MPGQTEIGDHSAARRFAFRLALLYGAVFGLVGISLPFFPMWLKATGIDVAWIGIITAVPSLTRFTVLPFITSLAERRRALRQTITILSFATVAGFAIMGQFSSPLPILLLFAFVASAWTPIVPLTDAYVLRGVARYGINYGPLRLWGSSAFIVGSLICGALVDLFDAKYLIWIIVTVGLLGALTSIGLPRIDAPIPKPNAMTRGSALLREPRFLAIIAASALIQGSHACYYSFAAITWQSSGLSGLAIAALWGIGVVAEIVLFAFSPRFTWSPTRLLIIAGVCTALRWAVTAQAPPLAVLAMVQPMHALSFGLTQLATVGLLIRHVQPQVMASGQGFLVAATGIVMSSATVISGQLYARAGQEIYYLAAFMALGGVLIALLARRSLEKSEGQNHPQSSAEGG